MINFTSGIESELATTVKSDVVLEAWGPWACFTRPENKVERLSYPIPTPSSMIGFLSAIYIKPIEFRWELVRVEVLNPIKWFSMQCNEVKCKMSPKAKKGINAAEQRTQRFTNGLRDVHYRIYANIVPRAGMEDKHQCLVEQARRRIRKGQHFKPPAFGMREYMGYYELYDPRIHTKKPINEDLDVGLMVYNTMDPESFGVNKGKEFALSVFHAEMKHGVIDIPPYHSKEVLKMIRTNNEED